MFNPVLHFCYWFNKSYDDERHDYVQYVFAHASTLNPGVVIFLWAGFIYYPSSSLTGVLFDSSPARDDAVLSRTEDVRRGWDADGLDIRSESQWLLQFQHGHITVRVHGVIMWRDDQRLDVHRDGFFLHSTH